MRLVMSTRTTHYGYEAQHYEGWSDETDEDFLVMSFAMLSDGGLDLQSEEACAYAAECLQLEHEAYLHRPLRYGNRGHRISSQEENPPQ